MKDHFPDFDFERSPYTGWTRAHWQSILARVTYGYVRAADKQGSYARVLYPEKGPFKDTVYYDIYGPTIVATNGEVRMIKRLLQA